FTHRAVAAYMAGPTSHLEGLLSATTFNEVVDRSSYYQAALDADSTLIDEIGTLRDGIEERRIEVEERQEEISEAKLALQADRAAKAVMHEETSAVLAERRQLVAAKRSRCTVEGRLHAFGFVVGAGGGGGELLRGPRHGHGRFSQ
ncbi:MAG: hypothetical protein KY433_07410, partial [Actinobacteria bacterium]|nr:hypothetical protein [Actinomycetota bacterium]